jgi:hypothetical protein
MMDPNAMMQLAERFLGAQRPAGSDPGPRITLAMLAASEQKDCHCEACGHLRAIVAGLRAQVAAGDGGQAPADRPFYQA